MSITISFINEKGGVAKTTSAASIASILSRRGYKVVCIDMDPQGDLTIAFNVNAENRNIYDCLFAHRKLIASKVNDNLVLVGGDPRMKPTKLAKNIDDDDELNLMNRTQVLKSVIDNTNTDKTDFIIIDCPPNTDLAVENCLAVSDHVIIPTEAHNFSVQGLQSIIHLIDRFQKQLNENLSLLGILITLYEGTTNINKDLREWYESEYGELVFKTPIRKNTHLKEATHIGKELAEYKISKQEESLIKKAFKFNGLDDYNQVCDEIVDRLKIA